MPTVRALLLAVLALVVLVPIVPAVAGHLPTANIVRDRKTRTEKEKQQPSTSGRSKSQQSSASNRSKTEGQKKQDTTVTVGRGTLDPIGALTRGKTVEIRGTARSSGELCALQMFYADKPAQVIREVVPDEKKRCVFSVPVPDRPGAVGEGKAKLILTKATSGKKSSEARQVFTVS